MPDILVLLSDHVKFFPLVAFGGLILGGLSLPVSEDLIIITGALLSHEMPGIMGYNLISIYLGVICTDYLMYFIGRRVRSGAAKTGVFSRIVPEKALSKMQYFLGKYGIFTFIVCRFIPFGVRNILCITAGFSKLKLNFFAIYQFIASMISINTLFFLTYRFGEGIKRPLKLAGIILFIFFLSAIISLIIRLIVLWRRNKAKNDESKSGEADHIEKV